MSDQAEIHYEVTEDEDAWHLNRTLIAQEIILESTTIATFEDAASALAFKKYFDGLK